jgi:spoIIIJ-associated protein
MMKSFDAGCLDNLLHRIIGATHLEVTYSVATHPGAVPDLTAEISGPDANLLTAQNAEILHAIEHLAFEMRGLESDEHHLLSIDADHYKQKRNAALLELAERASERVAETGRTYIFDPMSSHERRQLHLALTQRGLRTSSMGEGANRAVVLYPGQPSVN